MLALDLDRINLLTASWPQAAVAAIVGEMAECRPELELAQRMPVDELDVRSGDASVFLLPARDGAAVLAEIARRLGLADDHPAPRTVPVRVRGRWYELTGRFGTVVYGRTLKLELRPLGC